MNETEAFKLAFEPITDNMSKEETEQITLSKDYLTHLQRSFGELNNNKKQNNRIKALKQSIISDIEKVVGNNEINLPHREWHDELKFFNQDSETICLIKKVSKEFAFVESEGEASQIVLPEIDTDTLVNILAHLEMYALEKYFNYPDCCVEFFFGSGAWTVHNVNWGGFIPCLKHKDLSLEEITELLGRNPITDDHAIDSLLGTPEPEEIYEEKYKGFSVIVDDNFDGTYSGYCYLIDEEGEFVENLTLLKTSSADHYRYFSKEEALECAKKFADNYKE